MATRFWIEYLKGERAGDVDDFTDEVVKVGRSSSDSKLKFDERGVSWEHAEFRLRDEDWWVIDHGSTNGTYVNDERAHNARLADGDLVKFGKKGPMIRFRLKEPSESPLPKPEIKVKPRRDTANAPAASGPLDLARSDLPAAASGEHAASRSSGPVIAVLLLLLCASLAVSALLYLHSQTVESKLARAEKRADDAEVELHEERVEFDARIQTARGEGEQQSAGLVDQLKSDLKRADREARERETRHSEQIKSLESNLTEVRGLLAKALTNQTANDPESEAWKRIERRLTPSVVFIATRLQGKKENGEVVSLDGWGTGFFVSRQGHIVTNKHVVQPWKFHQLAEQMVREGITVDEESYEIHVWIAGSRFLRGVENGRPIFDLTSGFSTTNDTLELVRTAPDKWEEQELPSPSPIRKFRYHENRSNLDLALLRAKGRQVFDPVPTGDSDGVAKLDEVLVLGFPAGPAVLEAGIAETSPARGQVRKVEATILVAAPMVGGNSGGPLIDRQGRVVGISTRAQMGSETLGTCLRIEHAMQLLHGGPW